MKTIFAAAALASVSATSALAADMPVKAPIYSKTPIAYNWTGFYAGVNAGGGIGRSLTNAQDGGRNTGSGTSITNLSPSGAIAGVQVGYNWQLPNFFNMVVGVEADIQHSSQTTSACIVVCSDFNTVNLQQTIGTFGTVRGRIGLTTGPVLGYVTGGYAYADVNTSGTQLGQRVAPVPFSFSRTRDGFVLGGGLEASLGGNWRGKIEYLYLDFGTLSGTFVGTAGDPFNLSAHVRDNIFRGGVNYAFNGNSTYKAPVANWSGLYIGGNVGSLTSRNQSSYSASPNFSFNAQPQTFQLVPDGYGGGAQIGYNWQSSAWVFGLEADVQAASSQDNVSCLALCDGLHFTTSFTQKTPYFGTVRGRLGYSVGSTLFYGTAGFAYGQINSVVTETRFGVTQTTTFNHSQTGYAVGAGMESPLGLFGPSWTMKVEYLYLDLGRTTDSFADGVIPPSTDIFTTRMQEHVFRTGINYHINAPVVARY